MSAASEEKLWAAGYSCRGPERKAWHAAVYCGDRRILIFDYAGRINGPTLSFNGGSIMR